MPTTAAKKSTIKEPKSGRPIMPALYGMGRARKGTMKWTNVEKQLAACHTSAVASSFVDCLHSDGTAVLRCFSNWRAANGVPSAFFIRARTKWRQAARAPRAG
jgi:hypothetical protein